MPGPGAYEILPGITAKGPQFYSKYSSSRAAAFHPPTSPRFADIRMLFFAVTRAVAKETKMKPGPGHYPIYPGITRSGVYFLSKYKSSLCRTFGKRYTAVGAIPQAVTPGPGTYKAPSDFGECCVADKVAKEPQGARTHRKSESQGMLTPTASGKRGGRVSGLNPAAAEKAKA